MTVVEFHTLAEASDSQRLRSACALVERAFLSGERVLVWLEDEPSLEAFDNLLWTFGDRSFVPHERLAGNPDACEAPVQLTAATTLPTAAVDAGFSTLLTLRARADAAALRFARVLEVVDAEPQRRESGRARFRFYREHGAEPAHFTVAARS